MYRTIYKRCANLREDAKTDLDTQGRTDPQTDVQADLLTHDYYLQADLEANARRQTNNNNKHKAYS